MMCKSSHYHSPKVCQCGILEDLSLELPAARYEPLARAIIAVASPPVRHPPRTVQAPRRMPAA